MADLISYPFDTIATRLRANEHVFETFRGELNKISRQSALKELFSGVSTTIPVSFISQVIYVALYESCLKIGKNVIQHFEISKHYNYLLPLIANPVGEGISMFFYLPFDIARTRLQVPETRKDYTGLADCLIKIYEKEGFLRLFNASHVFIFYTVVNTTVQMCTYEYCRSAYLLSNHEKVELEVSMAFSVFAALITTFLCNPIDIVLTRFQLMDSTKKQPKAKKILFSLLKNEGIRGFTKGVTPKIFGNTFYALAFYPVYEHFKGQYGVSLHD